MKIARVVRDERDHETTDIDGEIYDSDLFETSHLRELFAKHGITHVDHEAHVKMFNTLDNGLYPVEFWLKKVSE